MAPPFVARERELQALYAYLDLALAGQGQVCFVIGEAGSGKTTLLNEFLRRAMEAHPAPVNGAKVTLTGLADGVWSIEWWDTLTGERLATAEAAASKGLLQLAPPTFRADIAARLKKR